MTREPDPLHKAGAQRLIRRLDGFARGLGLGLDGATTREIISETLTDPPSRTDDEHLMAARKRMLVTSA